MEFFKVLKIYMLRQEKSEDKSKDKVDKVKDKVNKVLEPRLITDLFSNKLCKRHKKLPEISKSAENLCFFNNWDKLRGKDKLKHLLHT